MAKKKAKKKTVKRAAPMRGGINDSIKDAIKYPWAKMQRAFWFWLMLIPIFGWFPLYGYMLDFMQNIVKGADKELPKFKNYWNLFGQGFFYLVFALIVGVIVQIAIRIPIVGWIIYLYIVLIVPILAINYAVKRRFGAFFDIGLATKMVFGHFGSYIVMILKTIVTGLFWLLCSIPIITLIWTLPAMQFSSGFLLAQFYRKFK
ncbi:DUF4013 domain-containing protein [Candidatus Woesearchaeota archaeon]|nr:DUF4013 domain-containing protein [Candidatus Woesearchaeota archaeon]MBW3006216.1 DUF4013 domain-containing protein [Candidatus Woesearchaeota archaeon]